VNLEKPKRVIPRASMDQPLQLLQVGCGERAQEHLRSIQNSPHVELMALCDLDAAKLRETAARFNIKNTFSDMTAVIRAFPGAECVSIITPPTLRTSVVEPALEAGARAVLIEKPLALSPSEARRLEELGRERLIAVNTQYRWMPHWARLWPMLDAGELGQVRSIRASTRENILEQGPHILDLALEVARRSGWGAPRRVLASCAGLARFGSTPVPAQTSAAISFDEPRAVLHFDAGRHAPSTGDELNGLNIQLEITGSRGRFFASLTRGWELQTQSEILRGETNWPGDDLQAQPALFASLRDAVRGDYHSFPTSVQNAARVSDVMFACYASALERRVVDINEPLDDSVVSRLEELS